MPFSRKLFGWLTLYGGLLVLASGCVTAKSNRFAAADVTQPDFFPVLPWDPYHWWGKPPVERTNNGLDSIAACNFNMAGFVLPRDLPECRKFGLGAIMLTTDPLFTNVTYIYDWKKCSDTEIDRRVKLLVEGSGHNPSTVGYFINDEPGITDFPALGKAVAAVKKYAPGKLAYINLFPDYATLGAPDTSQLGTPSYDEYLERFVAEVKPQLISYDNYMVQYSMDLSDRGQAASYYRNLLAVRRVALEHHLPYLNIVASCQLRKEKGVPSPANLLFQTYTTLAAGYRGVTWYTYFGSYDYAPIDSAGNKTPIWAWLQEANRQVLALAPVMSRLTSTGVFFSAPAPVDGLPMLPGKLIESVTCSTPVMVGEFQHQNGQRYAMIVNLSLEHSALFNLKTVAPGQTVKIISSADNVKKPFDAKAGLWLSAGEGVLLDLGK